MKNQTSFLLTNMLVIIFFLPSFKMTPPQGRPLYCGFDPRSGFHIREGGYEYIVREGKIGDSSGIPDVIDEILNTLDISDVEIFVYIADQENNCFASVADGKRMIVADHRFLNEVNRESGTQWGAISILAHEVGNHIAGFGGNSNRLNDELDADYWSGVVLQKLGASKEASVACIMRYGSTNNSASHPNKYSRSNTIRAGWDDARKGNLDLSRCEGCDQ